MGISLRLDFIERTITAASDSPKDKQQSKMQTFHKIALLFACVALCASQNQAQEVPDKAVCEADVDDCVSSNTAFKCAMMFKNLTDLPLKVLDIIPDLIAQNDDPEITAELEKKEISFEPLELRPGPGGQQGLQGGDRRRRAVRARLRLLLRHQLAGGLHRRQAPRPQREALLRAQQEERAGQVQALQRIQEDPGEVRLDLFLDGA